MMVGVDPGGKNGSLVHDSTSGRLCIATVTADLDVSKRFVLERWRVLVVPTTHLEGFELVFSALSRLGLVKGSGFTPFKETSISNVGRPSVVVTEGIFDEH
ncbi:MAG: hypothetical protein LBB26_02285 [Puniceicoccales bacterium]|nr:hypothetical protein [Puniceicoccales bacterium]